MSVINSQPLIGASGNQGGAYNLTRSLRLRGSASASLSRTPSSASNRKTWTWSAWVKACVRPSVGQDLFAVTNTSGVLFLMRFEDVASTFAPLCLTVGSGTAQWLRTTQVFRDPSAWYHIVLAVDTTQATSSNRVKLYVNGSQVTTFTATSMPSLNEDTAVNTAAAHYLNAYWNGASTGGDGMYSEVNFIDGQALTPSSFGETSTTTGVWIPKRYAGTYGTNGFYLPFTNTASTSTLGNDFSGNGNTWTVNNVSLTSGATYDSMTDVPTLTSATAANYAVLNPLDNASMTITDGNLSAVGSTTYGAVRSSIAVSSGKWYCEVKTLQNVSGNYLGITPITGVFNTTNIYPNSLPVDNSTIGGVKTVGITIDFDALEVKFYINNTLASTQTIVAANAPYAVFVSDGSSGNNASYAVNFGQQPFEYTPPSGFVALNTFNLPTPTIGATASTQANKYFDAKLYTGTGSSRSVTGYNFSPDFVWIKERSGVADHALYDSVRGVQKQLETNNTNAETTETTGLTALNSDGFTVGALAQVNTNTDTYVAWAWDANGAGSSNTSGTITSTVSANTSAGFSVVTYTGTGSNATVGHGLGVAPRMIIVKCRNTAGESWQVYHANLTSAAFRMRLNSTDAQDSQPTMWNSTAPTSTVFSVGTATGTNANTQTYVAYCFAQVAGYSAFGSYTGNGSTDGVFVYTGFRPKYIMIKRTDTTTYQWSIWDTSRNTINAANSNLWADSSEAETTATAYDTDFLSNGFKLRTSNVARNASGGTFIYMAFAESPFKFANAR
jgi:hypothetical protein